MRTDGTEYSIGVHGRSSCAESANLIHNLTFEQCNNYEKEYKEHGSGQY